MQHLCEDEPAAEADASPGGAHASPPAAVTTMAQLAQLVNAGHKAHDYRRRARALELYERALAAAEAMLPHNSLVIASLLHTVSINRVKVRHYAACAGSDDAIMLTTSAVRAAMRDDAFAVQLTRRALVILHAHWRAGTLIDVLTPDEREYFAIVNGSGLEAVPPNIRERAIDASGMDRYIMCAHDAVVMWPPPLGDTAAEDMAVRVNALHCALSAAVQWGRSSGTTPYGHITVTMLHTLLTLAVSSAADGWLLRLRATCGMTRDEEVQLRGLSSDISGLLAGCERVKDEYHVMERQRAIDDVARHGLRRCALPDCGAVEPHPKAFKVCSRCRGAVYCSAAHQREDWRRHKRADGCKQQQTA
jgi:hypothetical protein